MSNKICPARKPSAAERRLACLPAPSPLCVEFSSLYRPVLHAPFPQKYGTYRQARSPAPSLHHACRSNRLARSRGPRPGPRQTAGAAWRHEWCRCRASGHGPAPAVTPATRRPCASRSCVGWRACGRWEAAPHAWSSLCHTPPTLSGWPGFSRDRAETRAWPNGAHLLAFCMPLLPSQCTHPPHPLVELVWVGGHGGRPHAFLAPLSPLERAGQVEGPTVPRPAPRRTAGTCSSLDGSGRAGETGMDRVAGGRELENSWSLLVVFFHGLTSRLLSTPCDIQRS